MIYKVYRSKVDHWLAAVLIAAPLLPVGLAVYLYQPFLLGITVFLLAIYGVAALPVSYEAGSDQLVIRRGLARTNISYSEIYSMCPTRSALSSPALSLDRIEIRYAQGGCFDLSCGPEGVSGRYADSSTAGGDRNLVTLARRYD